MQSPIASRKWIEFLRDRLKLPRHNESEQAIFRIVICLTLIIFLSVATLFEGPAARAATRAAILITGGYLVFGLVLLAWMRKVHDPMPARRILAMALDYTAISACLYYAGENGSVLLSIYLWVTLGNGFRFGNRYLYAATAMSITGFLIVFATSEYWIAHRVTGIGWIAGLAILPLFVARLVRRLTQLTQEAQAASKAKSQFLARMSHELRTPLNGVIGMTHVLMQTRLSPEQKDIADSVNASSQMLSELIENVLDFSKIEAGKVEIERIDFDLHALLNGLMTVFVPQARSKGIDFRLHVGSDVPFYLNGDSLHLRQVLVNLIGNATKFTETGHIDLSVRLVNRTDSRVVVQFEVLDTGIGIPLDAQERIFESFTQADVSTTRRYGGTGLGTTIAKQLVQLMGGTLRLRSVPGEGSVFWFEIPLVTADGAGLLELPSGLSSCRTLVVSADPMSVNDVTTLLSRWSIPFMRVAGAAHALATLQQAARAGTPYRIVLVDGRSDNVYPFQFVSAARADSDLYNLSAVLLRADTDRHPSDEYLKAGYTSVLRLPVDTRETFNVLHSVIAREGDTDSGVASLSGRVSRIGSAKRRLRILVAEDNRTNQVVIESILTSERHRVDIVADGEAALDALEKASYDLVIADLHMPNLGGLEAMRVYGFTHRGRRVPWLILTGDATRETLEECAAAGADGYLTKPVQPTMLLARVAQLTESAREAQIIALGRPTEEVESGDTVRTGPTGKALTPAQLQDRFTTVAGSEIERMQRALMDGDFRKLRRSTHALSMIASEFGATALATLAAELGTIPEATLPKVAGTVMHDLVRVYEESRSLLAATAVPTDRD